jgi:hypothetical protein
MSLRHGVKRVKTLRGVQEFSTKHDWEFFTGINYGQCLTSNYGNHTAVEVHRLHAQSLQVLAIQDKDWVSKTKI